MRSATFTTATIALLAAAAVAWWLTRDAAYRWPVPAGMPPPIVPATNPMSAVKVELGRWLFHDRRLSVNGTLSCAGCHVQALAFTDGRPHSIGATGEAHPRGAMSLVNVAYASRLTWANPQLERLEDQALTPLFSDAPVEMGMAGRESEIARLLEDDPRYAHLFPLAFPDDTAPYSVLNLVRATSAFVRSIVSYASPYDAWLAGDENAISAAAKRGEALFFSERLECFHCHGGINFTDSSTHANARVERVGFHNTGLYNVRGDGSYPAGNTGIRDLTGERRDMGRFRAPSLRNVAVTAPYMHDGSIASLDGVIDHYARGGRLIETGAHAGDGRLNPYKSAFVRGFELDAGERADLIAFLESLTDPVVLTDPRWGDPFAQDDGTDIAARE